jgi:hypothetical protein
MIENSVDFSIRQKEDILYAWENYHCFSPLSYSKEMYEADSVYFHFKQPADLSEYEIKEYLLRLQAIPEIGHYIKNIPKLLKTRTFIMYLNECNATQLLMMLTLIRNIQECPAIVKAFNKYSLKKTYPLSLGVILKCISEIYGDNPVHGITYYLREPALDKFIHKADSWDRPPISESKDLEWSLHYTTGGKETYFSKFPLVTEEMFKGYINATNI